MFKIFCIWAFLLPLTVWQGYFEVPKVFVFLLGGLIILLYFLVNLKKLIITKSDKWYLLWLLTLLVSSFLGEDLKTGILGGSYRHQGLIFFLCLWLVIKFKNLLGEKERLFLYKCVGVSVLIEAILVLFGFRLGTIGDINAVSGFLAIGIFFTYKFLPKSLVIIPLLGMVINFSKTGFLSLIPYLFKRRNIPLLILATVVVFIIKPINSSSPFENRQVIWAHTVRLILEKPIFGYGPESNEVVFDKAFYKSGFPLSNLIIDRSHNLFLDITLWSGIIGLIFFCRLLYEIYIGLDNNYKKVFISFLIYSMFQPLSVSHWILFAL